MLLRSLGPEHDGDELLGVVAKTNVPEGTWIIGATATPTLKSYALRRGHEPTCSRYLIVNNIAKTSPGIRVNGSFFDLFQPESKSMEGAKENRTVKTPLQQTSGTFSGGLWQGLCRH